MSLLLFNSIFFKYKLKTWKLSCFFIYLFKERKKKRGGEAEHWKSVTFAALEHANVVGVFDATAFSPRPLILSKAK